MEKALAEFQKEQAVKCFNQCWDYMEKETRTPDEDLTMIHCAHASRYLWEQIGKPVNLERGEWQVSRMYTVLGKGDEALYHAKACLRICEENDIKDWDIAFAYEAMARAYKVLGDTALVEDYKKKGYDALPAIKEKGDRDYTQSELDTL